ncbi:phage tail protein [Lactobacillus sp. UCMA15818]|uniref:phage tail protein n=1 Tax=Lactobacillus sp. UCMA15818 TaxID=2583394 RepID=UPI0025B1DA21|nr:phage tail protein [Lactobacillus sp. UCMA15818]MDN2452518.1 hypothetical protein [Lactobacillus sp. UCMA15818]
MTLFYDKDGNGYIAQMNLTRTIDVSGNISISGTIFNGDDVLQNIGYGWSFKFQDEKYVISYTKLNDEDNTVEFDAVHKFLWDFSKSVFYESWSGSHTFEAYLSALFSGSGYTYDLQTTVAAFEKDNWGMKNKADLLSDIISDAGVELEISNLKVTIKAQIGSDLTSIARYGINLSDLIEENNISNFATHGKGFGAYNDEDDTSKGRLEVEYTSDLAETYGILDLDPIVDERYTISDNLLAAVKTGVDATFAVSVSLNMYDLENAGYPNYDSPQVGDWILAIDEKLNFKRKVRIIKLEEEFDANEKRIGYTVTAGDLSQAEQLQSAQVSATNAIQQLQQDVITVYYSANGKNRTFTGTDDPNTLGLTDLISGDIYWRTNGDKKELWIYDGTRWNQEVSDATGVEISENVTAAMTEADTAKQNASTAVETANTAINNASVAITNAQNAADTANTASEIANTAISQATSASNVANAVNQSVTDLKDGSTMTIAELKNGLALKMSASQVDNAINAKGYATQTWTTNQITTTASGINATISSVQTQVNNSAVGTNLIIGQTVSPKTTFSGNTIVTFQNGFTTDYIPVTAGEVYTISIFGDSGSYVSRIATYDSAKTYISRMNDAQINTSSPETITIPVGVSYIKFGPNTPNNTGTYNNNFKLEKGSTATDYSTNPADNATVTAVTSLSATVDGLATTVSKKVDNDTFTSYQTQVSNAFINKVDSSAFTSYRTQTDQAIQQRVTSDTYNSDQTILSGLINSKVSQTDWSNSAVGANLVSNSNADTSQIAWDNTNLTKHSFYNGGQSYLFVIHNTTTSEVTASSPRFFITSGKTYTLSFKAFNNGLLTNADVFLLGRAANNTTDNYTVSQQLVKSVKFSTSGIQYYTVTFTVASGIGNAYLRFDNNATSTSGSSADLYFNEVKVELGSTATPWCPAASEIANYSQVQQLSDNINLRVQKKDVINQINVSSEGILIDGAKVHITGTTTIDSAVIKDAMISSLSASKLTAGKIDASLINVINLNANNISTGIISGSNLSLNLSTGEVLFQKGSIKSSSGTLDIEIDSGTMSITDTSRQGVYFNLSRMALKTSSGTSKGLVIDGSEIGFYESVSSDLVTTSSETAYISFSNVSTKLPTSVYGGYGVQLSDSYSNSIQMSSTGITIGSSSSNKVDVTTKQFSVYGKGWVVGDFSVSGTKNAIVQTSKGWVAISAYETAEYYFGDMAKVNTGSGSKVKVMMDSLFLETVNTNVDYHVFVSSYGNGYAWVSEQGKDYFIIESNVPNLEVSYEVKAKRLGYENTRLEIDEDFGKETV